MSNVTNMHYFYAPCHVAKPTSPRTMVLAEITCGLCKKRVKKYGLQPAEVLLKPGCIPVFLAQEVVECSQYSSGSAKFRCPCCGAINSHPYGTAYRVSACGCWRGYVVEMPGADGQLRQRKENEVVIQPAKWVPNFVEAYWRACIKPEEERD